MRGLLLFLAALSLAGCDAAPAAAPPATAPRLAAPHADGLLTVGEAGVGPITANTPFSAEALAALFPDAEVRDLGSPADCGGSACILVTGPGFRLRVDRDPSEPVIGRIHLSGEAARGPNGEEVLQRGLVGDFSPAQCRGREAPGVLTALCRRTADSHVGFLFSVGDFAPPRTAPTPLQELGARGYLAEIVWDRRPV